MKHDAVLPFSPSCAKALVDQINTELSAGYAYYALYTYFSRHDVALNNVAAFFKKSSKEEHDHADLFAQYLIKRGVPVTYFDIKAPAIKSITLLEAFQLALEMEQDVHSKIKAMHALADKENEAHFAGYLEAVFLEEQIRAEHELIGMIARIKRVGNGLGEYIFDKDLVVL